MKKTIIIFGGCGFVGTNLYIYLNKKFNILLVDNFFKKDSKKNFIYLSKKYKKIKFINADVRNFKRVNQIVKEYKPFFIIILSSQVSMNKSIENKIEDLNINLNGTVNILEAYSRLNMKFKNIIFTSSNKVYGDLKNIKLKKGKYKYIKNSRIKLDEDIPIDLKTPYGCSKGCAEIYIKEYSRLHSINYYILRHSSIYGIHQNSNINQGWFTWFLNEYKNKLDENNQKSFSLNTFGNGYQVRDLLHVEDLCNLYLSIINKSLIKKNLVLNIGGGAKNSLSINELINLLNKKTGLNPKIIRNKERYLDQKYFVSCNNLVFKKYRWKPKINYKIFIEKYFN